MLKTPSLMATIVVHFYIKGRNNRPGRLATGCRFGDSPMRADNRRAVIRVSYIQDHLKLLCYAHKRILD